MLGNIKDASMHLLVLHLFGSLRTHHWCINIWTTCPCLPINNCNPSSTCLISRLCAPCLYTRMHIFAQTYFNIYMCVSVRVCALDDTGCVVIYFMNVAEYPFHWLAFKYHSLKTLSTPFLDPPLKIHVWGREMHVSIMIVVVHPKYGAFTVFLKKKF